jgi:hypothetical protein
MRDETIKQHFDLDSWPDHYGDIGIEIEMEGTGLKYPPMNPNTGEPSTFWVGKHDNSMKGEGIEYYLVHPIKRSEVRTALKQLKDHWKNTGGKPKPTNQDAVHVHMNCRDLSQDKTMTFIMLLVFLEDLLVRWCGDEREGNLFCLRSRDAEAFLSFLRDILIRKDFGSHSSFSPGFLKYATINVAPLANFGSVEIRCMQTPKDIMLVETWVEMLCSIFDAAMKLGCARDVVDVLSYTAAEDLLTQIFGDNAHQMMFPDVDQLLFDGRERVKQVVYSAHIFKERKKNKALIAPPPKSKKIEYNVGLSGFVSPATPVAVVDGINIYTYDGFVPSSTLIGKVSGTQVKKYKLAPHSYFYKVITGKMYSCNKSLTKDQLITVFGTALCGLTPLEPADLGVAPTPPAQATNDWVTSAFTTAAWLDDPEP